mmetsp:Transcript_19015/g.34389  ORF Transcript_19015/g.34389 Transcript_19015/m.34389 type:complete len:814 (+) Transcript_19015:235-2676(+)
MANSLLELRTKYDDFLREDRFGYTDKIGTAIDDHVQRSARKGSSSSDSTGGPSGGSLVGHPRLRIPMSDLRSHDSRLSNSLQRDPLRHIRALESAAHEIAVEERPGYDKNHVRMRIALGGPIGSKALGPRELGSSSLRRLVCVEGVAVKVSSVKPKVVQSVHYCPATRTHEARSYVDATDPQLGLPVVDASGRELPDKMVQLTSSSYPTQDKEGNALETEFGLSVYKDHQTITLQEMPERAPMGQLPRSVELILDHDLVDKVKPGDRVQIVGVYRALSSASQGQRSTSGVFPTVVLVNDIRILGRDSHGLVFTPNDVRTIRSLGKRSDILDVLGRSVCPSIHGHDVIKKALALQLLSGCEKNLANGTHLRGDINILMVGDPSTAKSQLLRSAMGIAPLAVSTTGKGSSGVGLTAAVTSDPETKERRLEAGAMVLADRGLVCVDEFDKMGEGDRVAIHEAMEQQTVTIAKAGIHASLNARCSVLAAANPVYGQYDRKRRIQENIGLPDSLLSRFDLLFVVLDQMDPENDRRIAAHVIRGHRYVNAQGKAGHDSDYDDDDDETSDEEEESGDADKAHAIWTRSRYDTGNQSGARPGKEDDDEHSDDVLQHEFLRKYLHFAKTRMKPVLTEEARECIAGRYAEMRSRQDERTLPVTARSLETIIRLASANAKARLSNVVEADPDVAAAMDILSFALYHENNKVVDNPNDPAVALGQTREREEPDLTDTSDIEESDAKKQRVEDDSTATSSSAPQVGTLADLKTSIYAEVSKSLEDSVSIDDICVHIEDRALVRQAIQSLEEESRVMHSEGEVYLID